MLFATTDLRGALPPGELADAFRRDYQETEQFRSVMSNDLRQLLCQLVDGGGDATVLKDNNLRYGVWKEDDLLAGSLGGIEGDLSGHADPGYNCYLEFQDGRVRLWKDGEERDLYGDGVYRGAWEQWRLPGYHNLDTDAFVGRVVSAGETPSAVPWAGVTIRLAAAEMPVALSDYSELLNVVRWQQGARRGICLVAGGFLLGAVLLAWSIWQRKQMARALAALGAYTGRVWLELKLLALGGVLIAAWSSLLLCYVPPFAALLAVLLWTLPLFLNDVIQNRGRLLRQSFCFWAISRLRGDGLDAPIQRRLVREGVAVLTGGLLLTGWSGFLGVLLARRAVRPMAQILLLAVPLVSVGLVALWVLHWRQQQAVAEDLGSLERQIEAARRGETGEMLPPGRPLAYLSQAAADVGGGLQQAVEERTRSERMKVELITNVSHDLKTPLTSILSYADLLVREEGLPEDARDYARILREKALRLKTMVQEVFDVSKAASGELDLHWERLDLAKLLRQTLADLEEPVADSGLVFRTEIPTEDTPVRADGDRLYRVFQNLIQNALQYALPGSRVYLRLMADGDRVRVLVQNISGEELPQDLDFTGRFVRGDASRTDGGSGLGLAIAKSFTEACGGRFCVRTEADLFTAEVELPRLNESPEEIT